MTSEQKPARRIGRRTLRTPERAKVIAEAIGRGVPIAHAARIAGVSPTCLHDWRAKDAAFEQQIQEAIARGIEARLAVIERASEAGDWRASAWLLSACQPEHFSKTRVQVEAVGQVEHSFVIPTDTLNQIAEARKRHEQQAREITEGNGA